MKVAFIARTETPNGYYRGTGPMAALGERGHLVAEVMTPGQPQRLDALGACDLLLVHRYSQGDALRAMRYVHDRGMPVVWDNDDDLTAVKSRSRRRSARADAFERQQLVAATRRVFGIVSAVTTPSAHLARMYADNGATRTEVIENYVPSEFLAAPRRPADGSVTIGWVAAFEHAADAGELGLAKLFVRLLDAHPQVRLVTVGVDLGVVHERWQRVRPLSFHDLPRWTSAFDVGIAPLADSRLNRARSNVKLKEYAAAGTPWLASPVGPYVGMGEAEGGRLVAADRWYEELERLVVDAEARAKLARSGLAWARGQTIERNVDRWERLLGELVSAAPLAQSAR